MMESSSGSWREQRRERQRRKRAAWLQEPPIDIAAFYRDVLGIKNEEILDMYTRNTRYTFRDKGEVYVHPGEPVNMIRFLISGVSRGYVLDENGQDHNICFGHEYGEPLLGATTLSDNITLFLEAVTDMEMLELPAYVAIEGLRADFEVLKVYESLMARDHQKQIEAQIALGTMNGEDRYKWFCDEYADIVNKVPQNYIASFLGIQPQSLSRIKRTLKEKSTP